LLFRYFRKRPLLHLIKITGLVLAFSSLTLIALYLKHELSFDSFHSRAERIYRFTATSPSAFSGKHFARIWGARYVPAMAENFPEIEEYVRLSPVGGGLIYHEEKPFPMDQTFFVDSTYFRIFDDRLLQGNPQTALEGPGSMVISESYAQRIFGRENPMGQVLTIPTGRFVGEELHLTVNGIMEDNPGNSHMHPQFIATPPQRSYLEGWAWTYLLLNEQAGSEGIREGFPSFLAEFGEQEAHEVDYTAHLQKITDIHLKSAKTREIEANGSMLVVYSFSMAVLILLFIALANYANLNRGMLRLSDSYIFVGRVFGASRRQQLLLYLCEGVLVLSMVLVLTWAIVYLGSRYIHQHIKLDLLDASIPFAMGITLGIAAIAFMAGFMPQARGYWRSLRVRLKSTSGARAGKLGLNKGLIVFQYTIAIMLMVAVGVIQRQTRHALQSAMGAEGNNIVCMEYQHSSIIEGFRSFKEVLLDYPSIEYVSAMFEKPGGEANDLFPFEMEGYVPGESGTNDNHIGIFPCDYSLPSLFGLRFLAGRDFSETYQDEAGLGEYLINESALQRLGFSEPRQAIGRSFQLFYHSDIITIPSGQIIGVVEDFHLSHLKRKVGDLVLFKRDSMWIDNLLVAFSTGNTRQGLKDMEMVWEELFPGHQFTYQFVDEMYEEVYLSERLQAGLLLLFTMIALFISSMGLLGLSLLSSQERTREIGLRIVVGADAGALVRMINWDFLKWILLSAFLALPLSWLAMRKWMESFAYKTDLSWWIFLLACLLSLLLSGLTVSIHSWRAARMNPVDALRDE